MDFEAWVAAARSQSLLRLAFVLTGNRVDAEDVVQDALSRALEQSARSEGADAEEVFAAVAALPPASRPARRCADERPPDEVLLSRRQRGLEGGRRVADPTSDQLAWTILPGAGYLLGAGVPEPAGAARG